MKFRMVWIGSDDDPDETRYTRGRIEGPASGIALKTAYQALKGEMVRSEQRPDGRARVVSIANFTARIVRDVLIDEETENSRRFILKAETGDQRLSFALTAVGFRTR